jgi:hypothetical protein
MSCRKVVFAIVLVVSALTVAGCGKRETPEEHLARLRSAHDIVPTGATTIFDREGNPRLVVDLRVTNQSAERLDHLTVTVRVEDADGTERLARPVTLDLSDTRPGVGVQLAAIIDGYQLADDDQVFVEILGNLTPEELRALPEFADLPR